MDPVQGTRNVKITKVELQLRHLGIPEKRDVKGTLTCDVANSYELHSWILGFSILISIDTWGWDTDACQIFLLLQKDVILLYFLKHCFYAFINWNVEILSLLLVLFSMWILRKYWFASEAVTRYHALRSLRNNNTLSRWKLHGCAASAGSRVNPASTWYCLCSCLCVPGLSSQTPVILDA